MAEATPNTVNWQGSHLLRRRHTGDVRRIVEG